MDTFLNNAVPWMFTGGVFAGGVWLWKRALERLNRLFPEKYVDPTANFGIKLISSFQNEFLALIVVFATLGSMSLAGRVAWFFVGKTTVASAAHATILGAEGLGGLFTNAADVISNFDGGSISPEDAKQLMEEKSIFNADEKTSFSNELYTSDYSTASYTAPSAPVQSAPMPVQSAPVAPVEAASAAPAEAIVDNGPSVVNAAPVAVNGEYLEYKVKAGDNMFAIAQRYYGNGYLYQDICGANVRTVGGNCSNIAVGTVLKIPSINGQAPVERPVIAQEAPVQQAAPVRQNVAGSNQPAVVNQPVAVAPAVQVQAQAAASGMESYTIKPGDSIFKIAQAAGGMSNVYAICSANRATLGNNCDQLTAGATIVLPSK